MSDSWIGRNAFVTGAGTGIGAATAFLLASRGATVFGMGPDLDQLNTVVKKVEALPELGRGRLIPIRGDVTDSADREAAVSRIENNGPLHLLVNNAAVFLLAGVDATHEQWERTLQVNLLAPAQLAVDCVGSLERAHGAAIVNVTSISAHVAQARRWTYNSAKAGLLELTRCQALDLAGQGIRVNAVSPGWVWTEALDQASAGDRPTWEKVWGKYSVQNRCGEPREVAEAICFLGSDAASFITGTELSVDGGYLAMGPEGTAGIELER